MSPSVLDKLKSMGKLGNASDLKPPPPQPRRAATLEHLLEGRWLDTRQGETFVTEQAFSADYVHGALPIKLAAPLSGLAAWAGDERLNQLRGEQLAFLDTETSGLAGGTGTYAFLVGIGRFVEGDLYLSQFFMQDPSAEPALLEAIADYLAPCAALVTFNGKTFDAPLLRTRYTLHGIPCPFEDYAHIDLLSLARRLWRDRLPSRALKYLEEHLMQAPRSLEDVPGYEIPHLYFDYLRTGKITPLKGVFYHNAMDLVAMAALLNLTAGMLDDPHGSQLEHGLDIIALAKLFEALNRWDDAARLYERGLKTQLPEPDFWQAVQRLAVLQKRRGDLATALKLWEQSAAEGHVYAYVELAKYYEHTLKDPAAALQKTLSAVEHVNHDLFMPAYMKKHWLAELEHRQQRLSGKLKKKA